MIIIRAGEKEYFAASAKAVPGLVQELTGGDGIEATINKAEYFEFNTRENRTGEVGPFSPLSELVVVNCGLARQDNGDDDEEEAEEENAE